jgi:hypothetical protein
VCKFKTSESISYASRSHAHSLQIESQSISKFHLIAGCLKPQNSSIILYVCFVHRITTALFLLHTTWLAISMLVRQLIFGPLRISLPMLASYLTRIKADQISLAKTSGWCSVADGHSLLSYLDGQILGCVVA